MARNAHENTGHLLPPVQENQWLCDGVERAAFGYVRSRSRSLQCPRLAICKCPGFRPLFSRQYNRIRMTADVFNNEDCEHFFVWGSFSGITARWMRMFGPLGHWKGRSRQDYRGQPSTACGRLGPATSGDTQSRTSPAGARGQIRPAAARRAVTRAPASGRPPTRGPLVACPSRPQGRSAARGRLQARPGPPSTADSEGPRPRPAESRRPSSKRRIARRS